MFKKLRKAFTVDREAATVHVTEQIGPNRALTPEGFLLCSDVPFARVGEMIYGPGEVPIQVGRDGLAHVVRDEAALFARDTVASFNGKPIVNEHPDEDVRPKNWRLLSVGVCLNPRRGAGDNADVLEADFLITDARAIEDVLAGKREVSAGYEADYEQLADGLGRQTNIIGNHIALVERGRCGPRCAIGDHQPKEHLAMTTTVKSRRVLIADRIRRAFKDAGEEILQDPDILGAQDDPTGGSGDTHIHIHAGADTTSVGSEGEGTPGGEPGEALAAPGGGAPQDGSLTKDDPTEARFKSLEDGHAAILAQLATLADAVGKLTGGGQADTTPAAAPGKDAMSEEDPPNDGDADDPTRAMTGDSVALETSFREMISGAEILVPGFRVPTFDSKAQRKVTVDSMCATRRRVLDQLYATSEGKTLVDAITGVTELKIASCAEATTLFNSAVGAKRLLNNQANTRDARRVPRPFGQPDKPQASPVRTLADLNRLHSEYHSKTSKVAQ